MCLCTRPGDLFPTFSFSVVTSSFINNGNHTRLVNQHRQIRVHPGGQQAAVLEQCRSIDPRPRDNLQPSQGYSSNPVTLTDHCVTIPNQQHAALVCHSFLFQDCSFDMYHTRNPTPGRLGVDERLAYGFESALVLKMSVFSTFVFKYGITSRYRHADDCLVYWHGSATIRE